MSRHHRHEVGHHGSGNDASPKDFGNAFVIGIALNIGFVVVEIVYGLKANSMALLADAGHNFGDVLGLVLAWIATVLARRPPSQTHTYGMRRGTILAALANAVLLLIASGRQVDLNVRGAFLHMTYDALVSLGVVIGGGVILLTGWSWLDPLQSLAVAAIILLGSWSLLRDAVGMSLDAVPDGLQLDEIAAFMRQQPGVSTIHDLHVWPLSTTETALTCHCVMLGGHPGDAFLTELARELKSRFKVDHATIQIEVHADNDCALEPDHVV